MSGTILINIPFHFEKRIFFINLSLQTLVLGSSKHSYNNKLKKYLFVLYKSYARFSVFILGKYLWNHVISPKNVLLQLFATSKKQNVI